MDNEKMQKKRKITLCLMTLLVLIISTSSLFAMGLIIPWFDETMARVRLDVPIILLLALSFPLVKYGYMRHSERQNNLPAFSIAAAALIMLSFPVAYLIGTHILHGKIINGEIPFSNLSWDYLDYPAVTSMRIWCIVCSLLFFGCIASLIVLFRRKITFKFITITASVSALLLLCLSLYAEFYTESDNSWYYGSEKVLVTNTDECYKNAIEAYRLCCKCNDVISEQYYADLNFLLQAFEHHSEAELDSMSLKNKEQLLCFWKSILEDNARCAPNSESGYLWKRFFPVYKLVHTTLSKEVSSSKLLSLRDRYRTSSSHLESMVFSKMDNPDYLKSRTKELLSIIDQIDYFTNPFINYPDHPEWTMPSEVSWKAQERRKDIDARLKSFNDKYKLK